MATDQERTTPITIILESGDVNAQGDRAHFWNQLMPSLRLDSTRRWEIAVESATLPHPGQNKSVFVTSSLAENTRVGSSSIPLLVKIPLSADAGTYYYVPQSNIQGWRPLSGHFHDRVEVRLTYGADEDIPAASDPTADFTSVTVVIREAL